jgi:hypothetical protein
VNVRRQIIKMIHTTGLAAKLYVVFPTVIWKAYGGRTAAYGLENLANDKD